MSGLTSGITRSGSHTPYDATTTPRPTRSSSRQDDVSSRIGTAAATALDPNQRLSDVIHFPRDGEWLQEAPIEGANPDLEALNTRSDNMVRNLRDRLVRFFNLMNEHQLINAVVRFINDLAIFIIVGSLAWSSPWAALISGVVGLGVGYFSNAEVKNIGTVLQREWNGLPQGFRSVVTVVALLSRGVLGLFVSMGASFYIGTILAKKLSADQVSAVVGAARGIIHRDDPVLPTEEADQNIEIKEASAAPHAGAAPVGAGDVAVV
jgi:hypothetical protein